MNIEEIKGRLARKATSLSIGGFKPTYSVNESWLGKVYLFKEEEDIPLGTDDYPMIPLLQLNLKALPFIPAGLENIHTLTLFIEEDLPTDLSENGDGWLLREYGAGDTLVIKDPAYEDHFVRPFPLKATLITADYPVWDGGGIPSDLEDAILQLENTGTIGDYYDIVDNNYGHKVGGYPTFLQGGVDFGEDFTFMLQISSDEKARLNIIDDGTLYLAKNTKTGQWRLYCDFN